MSKKNKKADVEKHTADKFSREELIGFGTDAFSLNKAEYVSKKIMDEILYHVFETVRIHNVKKMDIDYSVYRGFINLQMIVNFGLIKPEKEVESINKMSLDFQVKPCKIDAWASGRAKVVKDEKKEKKEQLDTTVTKGERGGDSSKNKGKDKKDKKDKEKKEKEEKGEKGKEEKEIKKFTISKDPKEKYPPMQECLDLKSEEREHWNEIEQMKLKGYRAYFQEKQIETQKRKQLEKDQAERAKEEEKKKKQVEDLMKSGKLVSWDATGTFLPIKPIKESDFKTAPQPRPKIKDEQTILDVDGLFDLDKNGQQKKKKVIEVIKEEIPEIPKTVHYYQPNPMVSHNIGQGVTMEFYGKKKTGGKYDMGGGRLTMDQYQQLLDQIHPYGTGEIQENINESIEDVSEKPEENTVTDEKKEGLNASVKGKKPVKDGKKRLYMLFRDEIVKAEEDEKKRKKNQENIIKKKKKKEEEKQKKPKDKIELKNFNFKEIKSTKDKSIYAEIKENQEERFDDYLIEKKNEGIMPSETHITNKTSKRTRQKKVVNIDQGVMSQKLPKKIIQVLEKIKEENNLNEEAKKTKTFLPLILDRPKSKTVLNNKNNNKDETQLDEGSKENKVISPDEKK